MREPRPVQERFGPAQWQATDDGWLVLIGDDGRIRVCLSETDYFFTEQAVRTVYPFDEIKKVPVRTGSLIMRRARGSG